MSRQFNPFFYGRPVHPSNFIGREEEIETIMNHLASPERDAIALYGERRIGKTSLLHYLAAPITGRSWDLSPEQYGFIYLDCQGFSPFSLDHCLRSLLSLIKRQMANWDIKIDIRNLEEKASISATDLVILLGDIVRKDREIVLFLDEFDYIVGKTDPATPDPLSVLRALVNSQCVTLVVASCEPIATLTQNMHFEGPPFHNIFFSLRLGPFSEKEANQLIDKALQNTDVIFNEDDRKSVYEISRGHPYWLQNTCHKLFKWYIESTTVQSKGGKQFW